ncbi:hypothetical protein MKJ01_18575, partial [Chryseobacterium sp. SSA4.19]|uniref:RHS repeat-associated core domain-containing protein n=1 Tax=Chryseobacterium sp. SSA4.19 TaxID=2919915 RepID=UPI002676EFDD
QYILGQATGADNDASTNSLSTASYIRNIEDTNWTKTYPYYDTMGRVVFTHSINHLGGYTKTESLLDFAGVPQKTNTYHLRKTGEVGVMVQERFVYDSQNRLKQHFHQVDSNSEELLADNTYNELSQLSNKKVGSTAGSAPLQSIDYAYNIRGWMTDINKAQMTVPDLSGKLFAYNIKYTGKEGITNPDSVLFPGKNVMGKYNGNIAEVDWRAVETLGQNPSLTPKRYGYAYDKLNRLTAGYYQNPNNPNSRENTESIDYDLNGNITNLYRTSVIESGNTATTIDRLEYSYDSGNKSNRLTSIKDLQNNPTGYEGGGATIPYDLNGNMTGMPDKGISTIKYNYLNLPDQLNYAKGSETVTVKTKYGADGNKVQKENRTVVNGISGETIQKKTTDYLDGFQYLKTENFGISTEMMASLETSRALERQAFSVEPMAAELTVASKNRNLQFFPTSEGFYDYQKNQYIYQYKDHLGNTRVSFGRNSAGALETTDANDYYPFGMNHLKTGTTLFGAGTYKNYKYNGKELQETGMYDYGARFYMPDIGRWGVVDPLAEKYKPMSTYHMSGNNPIFYVDSNGMNYDDYGVSNNGDVTLIRKTEDNFDRLYKAQSNSDGSAKLDANGNAQKAISGEGKENKDYVKVNKESKESGTVISQLSGRDSSSGLSHGTTNNFTDARKVFQFAADNSRVEWSIGGFRTGQGNKFLVGTTHLTDKVQVPWAFGEKGLTYENNIYSGHTHPYTDMPQPHDVGISNPDAYNFIYYTGVGAKERQNYFVPFSIIRGKDGKLIASPKLNQRQQIKLPNLIK